MEKLNKIPTSAAIFLSAILVCGTIFGTAIFVYQDFKADFDQHEKDKLAAVQTMNRTLTQIYLSIPSEAPQQKLQTKSPPLIDLNSAALAGISDQLKALNKTLDIDILNQLQLIDATLASWKLQSLK